MDDWVYRNLRKFGNCAIAHSYYKKLGEENIINDLKDHGLSCRIDVHKTTYTSDSPYVLEQFKKQKKTYVIIEVV